MISDELTQSELRDLEQTNLFEAYYFKKLNDDERRNFENRLFSDSDFKQKYDFHVEVMEAIQRKGMKQELAKMAKPKVISFMPIFKYAAAACIVAFVAFGSGMFYDGATMRNMGAKSLAELDLASSRGSGYDADISKIHKEIDAKNFSDAQLSIDALREALLKDSKAHYASFEEMEYHKQIIKLTMDSLDWYQTILFMKSDQVFKARKWLRKISNSDSRYSEDAKLIYEKLLY